MRAALDLQPDNEDELVRRDCELEDLIAEAMPIAREGPAIVAAVLLESHRDVEQFAEIDQVAGATMGMLQDGPIADLAQFR